jgi:hypothetical protein
MRSQSRGPDVRNPEPANVAHDDSAGRPISAAPYRPRRLHEGLAVHVRAGNRIRVVVADSDKQSQQELNEQFRAEAVRLAVEGYSARRSVDVLATKNGGAGSFEPSLTIIDLYESGYAETACLNAPSAIHLTHGQGATPRIMHTDLATVEATIEVTGGGDALLAFSPGAARDISAESLDRVATETLTFVDPCRFRDDLLRRGSERAPMSPASPMAVLFRPLDR